MARGTLNSQALVADCLARIREREAEVLAWQCLDENQALEQARARDRERAAGRSLGPLHGVPVGIKDIIDTADMPTECGTALHAGRRPQRDAAVVARLRAAGAVILGKTVTSECATYTPGKTRNPHDPSRTPGGSSSGSAAAVAAGMVPLAVGTQTNASVIRPASFCGVIGFKPSHGLISCEGILQLSPSLDTLGWFARSLDDIALLTGVLASIDEAGPLSRAPRLAFAKTAAWPRADLSTREALSAFAAALGANGEEINLPDATAWAWHQTIMEAEMATHLDREWQTGHDRLSPSLREQLARGRAIAAPDYEQAKAGQAQLAANLAGLFDRFDAIVTPATCGTAPALASTGDPAFGTLWSLAGLPALSLPLLSGPGGLPLGVQLVGAHGADACLLQSARWLQDLFAGQDALPCQAG